MRANMQKRTTRGAGDKRDGRGKEKKTSGKQTLGDLWKGESMDRVHRVNKMDTTRTFRSLHYRDFQEGKQGI